MLKTFKLKATARRSQLFIQNSNYYIFMKKWSLVLAAFNFLAATDHIRAVDSNQSSNWDKNNKKIYRDENGNYCINIHYRGDDKILKILDVVLKISREDMIDGIFENSIVNNRENFNKFIHQKYSNYLMEKPSFSNFINNRFLSRITSGKYNTEFFVEIKPVKNFTSSDFNGLLKDLSDKTYIWKKVGEKIDREKKINEICIEYVGDDELLKKMIFFVPMTQDILIDQYIFNKNRAIELVDPIKDGIISYFKNKSFTDFLKKFPINLTDSDLEKQRHSISVKCKEGVKKKDIQCLIENQ